MERLTNFNLISKIIKNINIYNIFIMDQTIIKLQIVKLFRKKKTHYK